MRVVITLFVYLISVTATAVACFFAVIILAGPHSGIFPSWIEAVILALGWLTVLLLPLWIARRVWLRFSKQPNP